MQTQKDSSRNPRKIAETSGLIIVLLVIVLALGLWLRTLTTQPVVAQAKSLTTQSNENTPVAPAGVPITDSAATTEVIPNVSFASQSVNGITFYAGNYRLNDAGQLVADVCFDMIDDSDWIIWDSQNDRVVDTLGHQASITSISVIEIRYTPTLIDSKLQQRITNGTVNSVRDAAPDQKMGQRCDTVRYNLPSDFDVSQFTITINSIARNPSESDTCGPNETPYMQKIQAALDKKQSGIKIKGMWEGQDGGGVCGIEIAQKPSSMSDADAQTTLNDKGMFLDLFGIRGPWVFEGNIK